MEMTVEKLKREIDRMVIDIQNNRMMWFDVIKFAIDNAVNKINSATCEYNVDNAFKEFAKVLMDASQNIKALTSFRIALEKLHDFITKEEEEKNDD